MRAEVGFHIQNSSLASPFDVSSGFHGRSSPRSSSMIKIPVMPECKRPIGDRDLTDHQHAQQNIPNTMTKSATKALDHIFLLSPFLIHFLIDRVGLAVNCFEDSRGSALSHVQWSSSWGFTFPFHRT